MDFIIALKDTPIPTLLIVGGFIFLFLGIATLKKPIVIDITPKNRKVALIFGIIFIGIGLYLLLTQPISERSELTNMATETPTLSITKTSVITVSKTPPNTTSTAASTALPTDMPTSTYEPNATSLATASDTIVITEVLGNPCGADPGNEFIELYNNGEKPIDVGGWWITDGDSADEIVPWKNRYPTPILSGLVQTDTTKIPSHGFAIVLAPGYPYVQGERVMPYIFPEDTVILTVKDGQLLGDEENGIEVSNRDVMILYQGSEQAIDKVISTYGTPILSSSPLAVKDDGLDGIPYFWDAEYCWSVERILPINEDTESN